MFSALEKHNTNIQVQPYENTQIYVLWTYVTADEHKASSHTCPLSFLAVICGS